MKVFPSSSSLSHHFSIQNWTTLLFIPCLILTQISRSGLFVLQTDKWARKSFPSNPLLPPTYLTDTRVLLTANKWKWMPLTQSLSTLTKTDPWSASYSSPPLKSTEVQDWYSTPSPLAYTSCCLAASCAVSGSRWQLENQRVTSVSDFINLYFHLSPSNCWSFSPPLHLLCYRPAYPMSFRSFPCTSLWLGFLTLIPLFLCQFSQLYYNPEISSSQPRWLFASYLFNWLLIGSVF